MKHYPLIRTIYLYLFTLIGLVLLVIGFVRFLDMGLKAFVFTESDKEQKVYSRQPVYMPYPIKYIEELPDKEGLSEEEKVAIAQWLEDYKKWKETAEEIDGVKSKRHREASSNLSMILIGLPLYLYHWRLIKKETKNKNEEE